MGDEAPADSVPPPPSQQVAGATTAHVNAQSELRRRESATTTVDGNDNLQVPNDTASHHGERNSSLPFSRAPTSLDMQQYFVRCLVPLESVDMYILTCAFRLVLEILIDIRNGQFFSDFMVQSSLR